MSLPSEHPGITEPPSPRAKAFLTTVMTLAVAVTVFALPGLHHGVDLRVVDDLLTAPAAGRAKLRVVHGSIDAGEIDLVVPGATAALFDGVDFQSVTGYEELEPLNGPIEIRGEGQAAALATRTR